MLYYGIWPEGRNTPIVVKISESIPENERRSQAIQKAKRTNSAGASTLDSGSSCEMLKGKDIEDAKSGKWVRRRRPGVPQNTSEGGFKYRPQLKDKATGKKLRSDGLMVGNSAESTNIYKIKKVSKDGLPDGEMRARNYSSMYSAEQDYLSRYGPETFGGIEEIEKMDTDIPAKYLSGLSGKDKAKRESEIKRRQEGKHSYKPLPGDDKASASKSEYTMAFEKIYGKKLGGDRSIKNIVKVIADDFPNATPAEIEKVLRESRIRGMEAWVTGHRPGANQEQWWRARIYSLIMGGKTAQTADSDLYKILKGKKDD